MTMGKPRNGSKNPGGRPIEYTEEFFNEFSETLIAWATKRYAQFQKNGTADLWLGDFAFENGYSIQQLSRFAAPEGEFKGRNAKFSETYEWAKTAQGSWAIKDERINAKIRQLLLVNFHDIKDKVEQEHSGKLIINTLPGDDNV
jgi:hypothetical protein